MIWHCLRLIRKNGIFLPPCSPDRSTKSKSLSVLVRSSSGASAGPSSVAATWSGLPAMQEDKVGSMGPEPLLGGGRRDGDRPSEDVLGPWGVDGVTPPELELRGLPGTGGSEDGTGRLLSLKVQVQGRTTSHTRF
jgi:hypothetical protein